MSDFRLRVFQAVARHLSFTKAAQELFVTQPAVTKHIHELEEQYEQRLLARRGNRVTLTEAGRLLLAHAEAVAASAQQLDDQLHALRDPDEARPPASCRLRASITLSQYVLPAILPAFQQRYPRPPRAAHPAQRQLRAHCRSPAARGTGFGLRGRPFQKPRPALRTAATRRTSAQSGELVTLIF